jgi:hypothetical protein
MSLKHLYAAFVFTFILIPASTFSWNATAHKIIAKIAYEHLMPQVRDTIDSLVENMNQQYANIDHFVELAVWPDQIRSQKIESYTHWHYIDVAFSRDGTPLKNLMSTDNALWAVNKISPVVKNKKANRYERSRFLAFYAHIVSDLHQPLHTVSLITAELPNGDKGGNAYRVIYRGHKENLHRIWDKGVGAFDVSHSKSNINQVATRLMNQYPESYFKDKVDDLNPDDWIKEGMQYAQQFVYTVATDEMVSDDYIQNGKIIAEQQVALAGYRLARLLNQLLST